MPLCPNCDQWYEVSLAADQCPHCAREAGASAATAPEDELPALARFRNWAEAGFFEDLLHSNGVAAQLEPREQYDAVGGHWGHQLVLRVPADDFDRARALVQGELDEGADGDAATERYLSDEVFESALVQPVGSDGAGDQPLDDGPPLWKPLAVVLVAGGLAYLGTHGLRWARPDPAAAREAPPASRPSDLWRYLTEQGAVWQGEAGPGGARSRMWHDPRSGTLLVEEDRDGDGRFERQLQFRAGREIDARFVAPPDAVPKD